MHANDDPTPFSVTTATLVVLLITFWNAVRVYSSLINWQVLSEFGANPAYIFITGLFWSLTGAWLFITIRKRESYSRRANMIAAGLYYLWFWLDRLLVQVSTAPIFKFLISSSTIVLAIFFISLNTPAAHSFFKRSKDE